MKKLPKSKTKPEKHPAIEQELHERLAELEAEIRTHPSRDLEDRPLKLLKDPKETTIDSEKVVQFSVEGNVYAAGRSDRTYPGSNHARGVRHIHFYADGKVVLAIEGDFEDQQFGSNFRFKNIEAHVPGEWEADFVKITDELRHYRAKRKSAFQKKRATEHARNTRHA